MKILVLGSTQNLEEFKAKFSTTLNFRTETSYDFDPLDLADTELVFDFFLEDFPSKIQIYGSYSQLTVFASVPKTSLSTLISGGQDLSCTLLGFNGLPTMFNRKYLEVSLLNQNNQRKLEKICKTLNTKFLVVEDRVGMVTPRVVAMIINEAFYTVEEGTATRENINKGMKLGTNYPFGPFEWCEKIGIKNVYEILNALSNQAKDPVYDICPLLEQEYLAGQPGG